MSFDKITNPLKAHHLVGHMETDYIYTAGIAGEKFFKALKDKGKLIASPCKKCGITYMPPRMYCEKCFERLEEYVEVPLSGEVDTYTIAHEDSDSGKLEEPIIVAFIRIDDTDGGLIHRLGDIDPDEAKIGMRVAAVLKDKSKRKGGLKDIEYFKPE